MNNPRKRRRRRTTKKRSTRRRKSKGMLGRIGILGDMQHAMPAVGWGMVGYAATAYIPTIAGRFIALPDKASNPMGYWMTKVLCAAAGAFAVRQLAGSRPGRLAFTGAMITMGAEVTNDFVFPMIGLGAYLPGGEMGSPLLGPGGQMEYLNPGAVVEDYEAQPARLSPDQRI